MVGKKSGNRPKGAGHPCCQKQVVCIGLEALQGHLAPGCQPRKHRRGNDITSGCWCFYISLEGYSTRQFEPCSCSFSKLIFWIMNSSFMLDGCILVQLNLVVHRFLLNSAAVCFRILLSNVRSVAILGTSSSWLQPKWQKCKATWPGPVPSQQPWTGRM